MNCDGNICVTSGLRQPSENIIWPLQRLTTYKLRIVTLGGLLLLQHPGCVFLKNQYTQMREDLWHFFLWAYFNWLNITVFNYIHFPARNITSLLFISKTFILYTHHIFFILPLTDTWVGCITATMNRAAANCEVQASLSIYYISKSLNIQQVDPLRVLIISLSYCLLPRIKSIFYCPWETLVSSDFPLDIYTFKLVPKIHWALTRRSTSPVFLWDL